MGTKDKKPTVDFWKVIVLLVTIFVAALSGIWTYGTTYASKEQVVAVDNKVNENRTDIRKFGEFFKEFRKEQRIEFKEFRAEQRIELREIRRAIENR